MYQTLIVEDEPIAKKLFSLYVENSNDFTLSGILESAAIAEAFCLANHIDLVLMDICTAGNASGLEAAIKIKKSLPHIKVILITSQPEVDFTSRAMTGNVDSFYYKTTEEMELLDVMQRTMRGERVFPQVKPSVQLGMITEKDLTQLQIKILRELTGGASSEEIATKMHLSRHTVNNNINEMLSKTGFSSRLELACVATESGIVIKDI